MVRALVTLTRNANYFENGFIGRTDFIVARYSATSNGLTSNNQFRFQCNVLKVNLYEKVYAMSLYRRFSLTVIIFCRPYLSTEYKGSELY
jgi:hypothetical protein